MPLLQSDVAAGSQAWTNIQKNQLEQQYMPQHFAEQMTHEVLANQKTQAEVSKLQMLTKGDAALGKAFTDYKSKNPTASLADTVAGATELAIAQGGIAASTLEAATRIAETAKLNEARTEELKTKTQDRVRQRQLSILSAYDPNDPVAVQQGILAAQMDKVLPDGFEKLVARIGAPAAWKQATESLKTEAQKDNDIKLIQAKAKADEEARLKQEKIDNDKSLKESQQAIQRDNLDIKRTLADDRKDQKKKDQEETARRNRESFDSKIIRDMTVLEGKAAYDKDLSRLEDRMAAEKTKTYWMDEDKKREAAIAPIQQQYDALYEKKYGKALRQLNSKLSTENQRSDIKAGPASDTGLPQAETKPISAGVPDYNTFLTAAKKANPTATEKELKAYYDKTYGKK